MTLSSPPDGAQQNKLLTLRVGNDAGGLTLQEVGVLTLRPFDQIYLQAPHISYGVPDGVHYIEGIWQVSQILPRVDSRGICYVLALMPNSYCGPLGNNIRHSDRPLARFLKANGQSTAWKIVEAGDADEQP